MSTPSHRISYPPGAWTRDACGSVASTQGTQLVRRPILQYLSARRQLGSLCIALPDAGGRGLVVLRKN